MACRAVLSTQICKCHLHLSVRVIVLFLGACFSGSIFPMSTTIGTFAKRPATMQLPVGRSGTYSNDIFVQIRDRLPHWR